MKVEVAVLGSPSLTVLMSFYGRKAALNFNDNNGLRALRNTKSVRRKPKVLHV